MMRSNAGFAAVLAGAALLGAAMAGCAEKQAPTPTPTMTAAGPRPAPHAAANDPWGGYPPPPGMAKQIERIKAKGQNNSMPAPAAPPAIGSHM